MSVQKSEAGRRGRRTLALAVGLLLTSAAAAAAHDMYLKPTRYFAPVDAEVRIRLLNGTFTKSENSIARDRLLDVSVVSPTRRTAIDTAEWGVKGDTSTFHVHTRGAGTYVVGVSTRPRVLAETADGFNLYLEEDGLPDVLAARKRDGELNKPVKERYAKHIKTLIQVGDARSNHFSTIMGYPAEIVPVENPYLLKAGAVLHVRALVDGRPVANQLVEFGGLTDDESAIAIKSSRSDASGVAAVTLAKPGTWFVRFISMQRLKNDPAADYESKWATLTFQVK